MSNFNPSDLIALCALLVTLATTSIGAILWYVQSEKKKYASERDFQHIRNNQKSISDGIAIFSKDIEDKLDEMSKDTKNKLDEISRDILEINITLGIKSKKE